MQFAQPAHPVQFAQPAPPVQFAQPAQNYAQPLPAPTPVYHVQALGQPVVMAQQAQQVVVDSWTPLKQGWLIKDPVSGTCFGSHKTRWIVLFRDRIEWRESAHEPALGVLELESDVTSVILEDYETLEIETDGRVLSLHPSDSTPYRDLELWADAIRRCVEPEPVMMPGQPVYAQQQPTGYAAPNVVVVQQQQPDVVIEEERHGFGAGSVALGVGAGVIAGVALAEALSHRSSHSSHSSHSHRSSF